MTRCNFCSAVILPGYVWSHDDMVRDGWTHIDRPDTPHAARLTPYDIARGLK